jgi:phenylalanyl-tRNA synthetase alpha chain
MDARSLVKSLHPLEVRVLLRYGNPDAAASGDAQAPGADRLDAGKLAADLDYKEGHANQAFSWLSAKGLAAEDGREVRVVYELTPLGREFAEKGTPDERILRFLSEKGPAKLPEICAALGLEQKDVGSSFGQLSKEGALSMDGEKRALLNAEWFAASHGAADAAKPRIAIVRDLLAKAAAAELGILEEAALAAEEKAAMAGIAPPSSASSRKPPSPPRRRPRWPA